MTSQYDVRLIFAMEIAAAGDKQAFLFRGFQIMQCLLPAVVGRKYFNAVNHLLRDLIQQFIISAQILPGCARTAAPPALCIRVAASGRDR